MGAGIATVKLTSNIPTFLKILRARKIPKALNDMGKAGKANIDATTPFDTGELLSKNRYSVRFATLYFINDAAHAPFVELGTYKSYANPFMKRGIRNSFTAFSSILLRRLRV